MTICTDFKRDLVGAKERQILEQELNQLSNRFKGVTLDHSVIMSNHIHAIFLFNQSNAGLARIVQAFKSITTFKLKAKGFRGERFWQKNYYEHVIRDPRELEKIREYVQNNPLSLELKFERCKNGGGKVHFTKNL